jgi:hypothetical protein
LGDDVVIHGREVALKYQEVINSIGVQISMHKSIVPSKMVGIEFASKLICSDGNLSPLPVLLLTKPGLVNKVQFFCAVVIRILTDGIQSGPSLTDLSVSTFGSKLSDKLGDVATRYLVFSLFSKLSKSE